MPSELVLSNDLLTRLKADTPWFKVYDGDVPSTPAAGYCVVYPQAGAVSSDRLGYRPTGLAWDALIVCAGTSRSQVFDVVGAIRGRLVGWRPYPADKTTGRLVEVPVRAPLIKETVAGTIRYSLTLQFRLSTTRS